MTEFGEYLKFQFYDSPIKSPTHPARSFFSVWFQFYDSPIKSSSNLKSFKRFSQRFNSMIVRLKVHFVRLF